MKKILLIICIAALVAVAGAIYYLTKTSPKIAENPVTANDYKNASYNIEGQTIQLNNGAYETDATPDSVEIIATQYFGNEVKADFNNDGMQDVAFILTQGGGGTGIFYYVVAALKTSQGYKGTNAVFLGDRIAPQTTEFRNGQIIVNYADRKPDEPYSAQPSIGVSKYLKISGESLTEVSN